MTSKLGIIAPTKKSHRSCDICTFFQYNSFADIKTKYTDTQTHQCWNDKYINKNQIVCKMLFIGIKYINAIDVWTLNGVNHQRRFCDKNDMTFW